MYRNEWDAAVARASALEQQLRAAQTSQSADAATIASLTQQLQYANVELARLRGTPGQPTYAAPGHGGSPYGAFPYQSQASTVMVLGILSLVLCQVLGPIAWSMGNTELGRIDRGEADPTDRGNAVAGRVCGIVASIMLVVFVFGFVMLFGVIASH
jgi:hypothetical protein